MNKSVWTNELITNIHYDCINSDFDFYKVTTSDRYIKYNATFLDIESQVIRSIVYEDRGKSFYVMTKKRATTRSELISNLLKYDGADKLSLMQIKGEQISKHFLIQLWRYGNNKQLHLA